MANFGNGSQITKFKVICREEMICRQKFAKHAFTNILPLKNFATQYYLLVGTELCGGPLQLKVTAISEH